MSDKPSDIESKPKESFNLSLLQPLFNNMAVEAERIEKEKRKPRFFTVAIWEEYGAKRAAVYNDDKQATDIETINEIFDALDAAYPRTAYVYVGFSEVKQAWKIGIAYDVKRRAAQLDISVRHTLECRGMKSGRRAEKVLHNLFKDRRVKGEWFNLNPADVELILTIPDAIDPAQFHHAVSLINRARRNGITLRDFGEFSYYNEAQFRVR